MESYIICAAISKKNKKAVANYEFERQYFDNYDKAKWDDGKYNSAKIGNYFAFVHRSQNRVEIFVVTNILPPANRRQHWNNPDHAHRNVLVLSKKISDTTWTGFKERLRKQNGQPMIKDCVQNTIRYRIV